MSRLPISRAALYQQLGLVDAPLPAHSCGGCDVCRGAYVSTSAASYEDARHVAQARVEDEVAQREHDELMDRVQLKAQRSQLGLGRAPHKVLRFEAFKETHR